MASLLLVACTADLVPDDTTTEPLALVETGVDGDGAPVVTDGGDADSPDDVAAIQFDFDAVMIDDGRGFDRISIIPTIGAPATWDPAILDPDDPATYPPSVIGYAVEIRDQTGRMILESEPRAIGIADFLGEPDGMPSPFAAARWIFHPCQPDALGGCAELAPAVEIDPAAPGAAEWLAEVEAMILEVAATDWQDLEPPPTDLPEVPDDQMPVTPTTPGPAGPIAVDPASGERAACTNAIPIVLSHPASLARELPDGEDDIVTILLVCWDALNETWHWWKIYKKECFKGPNGAFELSFDCAMAMSGLLRKSIDLLACTYVLADKAGLVPTSDETKKLLRKLLVAYALTGKPQNVPKLPPPVPIVKPKK
jgi:hypothetical protein